jgi:type 1 glutamine amidotransferase
LYTLRWRPRKQLHATAAWIREHDGGRFFYTELGHDVRSLDTKFGRQHVLEGLRWAAGAGK